MPTPHLPPSTQQTSFSCPYPDCGAIAQQHWYSVIAFKIKSGTPWSAEDADQLASHDIEKIGELMANANRRYDQFAGETPDSEAEWTRDLLQKWNKFVRSEYLFFWDHDYPDKFLTTINRPNSVHLMNLSECHNCGGIAIWVYNRLIYPPRQSSDAPPANPDMPEEIQRVYIEAANILDLSPRGAAALLRLATEKLCDILEPEGNDLNEKIGNMVSKGLPGHLQKALDILRITGNNAVHSFQEMALEEDIDLAPALFHCINEIVEYGFSRQKRIATTWQKLPEKARKTVEKRDKGD